jgi:flagellar motility protein MotE (MotC chaperone)
MRWLQSPWMVSLSGCLLFLATTAAVISPARFEGVRVAPAEPLSPNHDPSWKFKNPEFEQWIEELKQERETLIAKEKDLREWQTRLEAERAEIFSITQAVNQLQMEFDKNVVRFKSQDAENLKRQTQLVAAMPPASAAKLLNEMADDDAVRILFSMKAEQASLVLEALSQSGASEAKHAAAITKRMRSVLPAEPAK